ncbi:MAG TPA: Ig-like domain-containing protein [Candidatus Paceibacterota bacterium]|nr:Ig-like domain-containing protein [Verrucomicrobiota bacterium]HSA13050.1 Ig-like domain-containing protein [Candidatus Paceibacterota bacterium]
MQVIRLDGYQGVRYDIASPADDFEIYDVAGDPKQTTNLAANPAFAALQQRMQDRVLRLRRPDASAPRPYDNALIPAVPASPITHGVEWKAYAEAFPWVPELTVLGSSSSGATNAPTLAVRPRDDGFGLLFTGYLVAPADGDYTFYVAADTGALLRIHDATVVDADFGYAGGTELSGVIKLRTGLHPFRLYYARRSGGAPALSFSWSGPGIEKQTVPESAFRRDGFGAPTPPIALDDAALTGQGAPVAVDALANDSDDGTPVALFIASVGQPQAGAAVTNAGQILYTPNSGFLGEDRFTYTISDGQSTSAATVRVNVAFADGSYWFPFNQTSGLTTGEAGGGATASLLGFSNDPAQWVAGRFNRALQFDGVANKAVINGFKGITGANPRTVTAWVKTAEAGKSIGIVSWGDQPSGDKWSLLVQNTTAPKGTLRLELGYGNTIAGTPVNDGQWHHVACTLDYLPAPVSTDVKFYVDGQPDTVVGGAFVAIDTAALDDVLIGSDIQNRFFEGVIDEVRIYDRALSAAEIASLFAAANQSAAAWHRRHFGNAPINWNGDDDGDGASRLGEYAFGGQPQIADPEIRLIPAEIESNRLQFRFHRRLTGPHELIYGHQSSSDLIHWTSLTGTVVSASPSDLLPGFEEVTFRVSAEVSATAPLFIRLSARFP